MVTIAGRKKQGRRFDRLTFARWQSGVGGGGNRHAFTTVSGPVLGGRKGQRGTCGPPEESYRLEVLRGAIPGVLASTTPHRSGLSTETTGLVDEGNGVHLVSREKRGVRMETG